jgi:hypothetical protein
MAELRGKLGVAACTALSEAIETLGKPEIAQHAVVLVIDARGQISVSTTLTGMAALHETLKRAARDTDDARWMLEADDDGKN